MKKEQHEVPAPGRVKYEGGAGAPFDCRPMSPRPADAGKPSLAAGYINRESAFEGANKVPGLERVIGGAVERDPDDLNLIPIYGEY